MKIAVISPNPDHLRRMAEVLSEKHHRVAVAEGGKSRMAAVADQEQPDLMLVEGICLDAHELSHVEAITTQYLAMAVVLLCSSHTPEFLLQSMRAGVREILPSPVGADALEGCAARVEAKLSRPTAQRRGKVLAFLPCKGGSGATFLATSLGWELAQTCSVLLVDLNLQFGDALSFLHDGKPEYSIADIARDIGRLDISLLNSTSVKVAPNFGVLAAPEDMAHAMEVKPEHVTALLRVASAHYDFVLMDMSRTIDPVAVAALDQAHRVFPVLQGTLPHVRHTLRLLDVFRSLEYPADKVELILNRHEKSAEIGPDEVRRAVPGVSLVTVANAYREVSAAVNHGNALGVTARSSSIARQLAGLAAALNPQVQDSRGLLDRLFRRA